MPRIRKKTSKRGTTNQRQKIKKKVSESHRKSKKTARKDKAAGNVHKKSKKDPGIPNDFPYKDQILAEAAQQRREVCHLVLPPRIMTVHLTFFLPLGC